MLINVEKRTCCLTYVVNCIYSCSLKKELSVVGYLPGRKMRKVARLFEQAWHDSDKLLKVYLNRSPSSMHSPLQKGIMVMFSKINYILFDY